MKVSKIKKIMISIFLGSNALVFAHSILDNARFYNMDFIKTTNIKFVSNQEQRVIASENNEKEIIYTPSHVNVTNINNIEKNQWEIVKIYDFNPINPLERNYTYDKSKFNDETSSLIVKLFVSNNNQYISINNDQSLNYLVQLQTKNKLVLFHKVGNLFETLELNLIKIQDTAVLETNTLITKKNITAKKIKTNTLFDSDKIFTAFEAMDTNRSRNAIRGDQLSGQIELIAGELILSDLVLHVGTNYETSPITFQTRILDGGIIRYQDKNGNQASAIVMQNGSNGYTITFSVGGELTGASVNFYTQQEIDKRFQKIQNQQEKKAEEQEIKNAENIDQDINKTGAFNF